MGKTKLFMGVLLLIGTSTAFAQKAELALALPGEQIKQEIAADDALANVVESQFEVDFDQLTKTPRLSLRSSAALVVNLNDNRAIYAKNTSTVLPIASITKLMTAMVVLDAGLPLEQTITVTHADVDTLRNSGSRLRVGTTLSRRDMMRLALMASENRAAAALARTGPGGTQGFVAAMNRKAVELGMTNSRFVDATGLSVENVSTAHDLARMVKASERYDLIADFSTQGRHQQTFAGSKRRLGFRNTNILVNNKRWDIDLSKTGYISESGRCLVMMATIEKRPVIIVLLDSNGKFSRFGDANRIKKWMEATPARNERVSRLY
ncbi:MAG: D-alanyl-D-alanine endopeptidase [Burkholderiales bacterium]|nr:D-alanyl-D-alanine endopeptidase [Pseudomonadota bacterium]